MTAIEGEGTPESHWRPWLTTAGLPALALPALPLPAAPGRALVLAAHPDDEVLGAGGLLSRLARAGWRVDVVWASDGEGSHPGSKVLAPVELARRRREESLAAREVLGLQGDVTWLGLPDSGLARHEDAVGRAMADLLPGADLLLAPWSEDGHPDHEVCGRVARRAGAAAGVEVWELPVWAWHWGTGPGLAPRWGHACQALLTAQEQARKARAVEVFVTQVHPLGPGDADRAVLPPGVLARFARDREVVLRTPSPAAAVRAGAA